MPTDGAVNPKTSRRLAAILAADIAGYSALMGADEARTVRDLKEHQVIVLPMIREHGGRVIDTAGDGILAAAKARGVQFGRKPKLTLHQQAEGRRRLEEARWIQVGITHLQHHVAPLLSAVLAQAINQRLQPRWSHRRVQC